MPSTSHRLLLLVPLVFLGCGILTIDVSDSATSLVPGGGLLGELLDTVDLGGLDDFDLTIEEALADQDVEKGDLRSVVLTSLTLRGDPDLGFVSSLDLFLSADGVAEFQVATLGDVPDGTSEAAFTLLPVDLAEAVQAGGMQFRVEASGDVPPEDTEVTAEIAAKVEATVQGACNALDRSGGNQ